MLALNRPDMVVDGRPGRHPESRQAAPPGSNIAQVHALACTRCIEPLVMALSVPVHSCAVECPSDWAASQLARGMA
jgi:hypothetical protein